MERLEPIQAAYFDYPRKIPLATPFGAVELSVTDGYHVYVDFSVPERPLVVRGQSVWGGLHLYRQPDGTFGPDGSPYGGQVDDLTVHTGSRKPLSKTAQDQILGALVTAVTAWAGENGSVFEAAVRGRHEANKEAVRKDIARLEDELRQRRAELAALERGEP